MSSAIITFLGAAGTVTGSKFLVDPATLAAVGRVLHHLSHLLPGAKNTVLMPGYQVAGTRGRQLLDSSDTTSPRTGAAVVRKETA
ncbi:hypothetical protein [Kribbella sp. NBC_00889]|uniref:hypothetical protein n=1 Tax=Kribbella sp. NBC_00889 TaxID=2975974 RepID=UPI00386ACC27|nr:integrator complex subunit 9 [Kribbella sp. NBC_00889]